MLKYIKIIYFLKKLFLRSAHQNDSKHIKILIFNKKINFLKIQLSPRFQILFY